MRLLQLLVLLSWLPLHASLVLSQPNHGETAFSEFTTHINNYTEATKKNLRLAGDAADNMKLVLGKTGEQLAKITDKGLVRLKNSVIPPVFTVLLDMGQLPVKFGDEFVEAEVKIVKYGDEVGVMVEEVDDLALSVATATEKQLDDVFAGLQNNPPFKYTPNTLEHKAERWAQYKIRLGNDAKDYSVWSNTYNANMTKATKAHRAADEVMASIGWGQREVTIQAGIYTRRFDIADKISRKGVEVKSYETGKVYATQAIQGELNADKFLIENDLWQIEWVFKSCEPSQPLRTLLEQAGITIKLVP